MSKLCLLVFAVLTLVVLLSAPVHADDEKGHTPEDAFKSYVAAVKKADMKLAMSHMTGDSQSFMAGGLWFGGVLDKSLTGIKIFGSKLTPEEQKHIDAIEAVLKRVDLSDDDVLKILDAVKPDDKTPMTENARLFLALGKEVKDKPAFVADMLKALSPLSDVGGMEKNISEAKLGEVKIDGKRAKAPVTFTGSDGKKTSAMVYFEREGESWKLDYIRTSQDWPQPPTPPQAQPISPRVSPPVIYYDSRPSLLRRLCPGLRR